jgi:hypothetical protein
MTTLAIMKATIAAELRRSNISDHIARAISTACTAYETEFGAKMQSRSLTVTTVANQEFYTTGLSTLLRADYVKLQLGNHVFDLDFMQPSEMESASTNGTSTGQPGHWTWFAEQLRLYPVPASSGWTVRIGGLVMVAAPASDGEADNPWMTTYERLIRCRAKWELATHVLRDQQLKADMAEATQEAKNQFIRRANNKTKGSGRVTPMAC